jgi:predicted TPR repeat methyltransferase
VPDDGWLVSGSTSADEVRGYYDEQAPTYDATLAIWGYEAPWRVAELLLQSLPGDRARLTVLDAGCGTGLAGQALHDSGFTGRLLGVDLSPDSVELALGRGVYDDVVVGDLQQPLAYADDSVDGVVCVGVLTYLPDVAAIWSEFCRVTRPGGAIIVTQRDDVWRERRCNEVLHRFERDGRWAVHHLSPPASYLPGNADFGDEIRVRYLAARVRSAGPVSKR